MIEFYKKLKCRRTLLFDLIINFQDQTEQWIFMMQSVLYIMCWQNDIANILSTGNYGSCGSASETFLLGLEIHLQEGFPSRVSWHVSRSDEVQELWVPAEAPVSTHWWHPGNQPSPSPTPCSSSRGQWYPPAVRRDATGHVLVMGIPPKDACVRFTGLANVPDFHWFLSFWGVSVTWNTRVPLPSYVSVPYALRLWAISTGSEMASAVSGFHWRETPLAH